MRTLGLAIKKYYLSVAAGSNMRIGARFLRLILLPFSLAYAGVMWVRNVLFDIGVFKSYSSKAKIISVGNITWGGTAKTSLVLRLAEHFAENKKVAVLSRGYAPDEPALIREWFSGSVAVLEGKDRVKRVKEIEDTGPLVILDDGFQYRYLDRDVDILLFNAASSLRDTLLPAGIYRERLSNIRRADCAVITASDMVRKEQLEAWETALRTFKKDMPVYYATYKVLGFFTRGASFLDKAQLQHKKAALLSGIAFPEGFEKKIGEQGIPVQCVWNYPDHHRFTQKDIAFIDAELRRRNIEYLITTYKDFFRIRQFSFPAEVVVMKVRLAIEDEERFFREIEQRLEKVP